MANTTMLHCRQAVAVSGKAEAMKSPDERKASFVSECVQFLRDLSLARSTLTLHMWRNCSDEGDTLGRLPVSMRQYLILVR